MVKAEEPTQLLLMKVADAGVKPLPRASAVWKALLELLMDESVAVQLRIFVGTVPSRADRWHSSASFRGTYYGQGGMV